jgi:DNA (cytosine-5)-methyltransferase 1
MLTFGSLFAGIGGLDLGLERAGMECKWQVEIDDFCTMVLEKHWPNVRRFRDVRECGAHNLPAVDLICGGFPCQPHSVAGEQRGAEDDRDLWPEYHRIVAELKPQWVVGENVPNIRNTILDDVLADLEGLGYTTVALDIPAIAIGARHKRHRIFIVAYATGSNRDAHATDKGNGQPALQKISRNGNGLSGRCSWWDIEPDVGRVVDGIPNGVDRLRALGNAVVPQVAEWIGRRIIEAEDWPEMEEE